MGTFVDNLHVHGKSETEVTAALRPILRSQAFVASSGDRWVTVCPDGDLDRDAIAEQVSKALSTSVLAATVHDSDVFVYTLYENGEPVDTYVSDPDYFADVDDDVDPADLDADGDTDKLAALALSSTTSAEIRAELDREELFAEYTLARVAKLLGIDERCALASMRYMDEDAVNPGGPSFTLVSPEIR